MKEFGVQIEKPICQAVAASQVAPNGCYQQVNIPVKPMSVEEYKDLSYSSHYKTPKHDDYLELERIYWQNITNHAGIYGADVGGSITDVDCEHWNISHLGSILDYVNDDYKMSIDGVNTAYLYFGMWKTTFAWHCEDMNLYSINLLHFGMPKTWYSIPPKYGKKFEQLANAMFTKSQGVCDAFLRHKMTIINPKLLDEYKIPYDKVTQESGQIMITFPYGYHSGFNHGFNCAESTNFATPRWVDYGKHSSICNCTPDAVKFSMDTFVERFQPDKYKEWVDGHDKTPHPENGTITPKPSVTTELKKISFKDRNPDLNINAILGNQNIPAVVKEELRDSYMVSAEDEFAEHEKVATTIFKKPNRSFYDNSSDEEDKPNVKKRRKRDSDYDDDWYATSGHELISADGKIEKSPRGRVSKLSPASNRKPAIKKEPKMRRSCPENLSTTINKNTVVNVTTISKNGTSVQLPTSVNVKIVVPNHIKSPVIPNRYVTNSTNTSYNDAFSQFLAKPGTTRIVNREPISIVKKLIVPKIIRVKNSSQVTVIPKSSPIKTEIKTEPLVIVGTSKPTPIQIQQELWTNQIIQTSSKSQPPPLIQITAQHSTINRLVATSDDKTIIQKVKTEKIEPYVTQELIVTPVCDLLEIGEEQKNSYTILNPEMSSSNTSHQFLKQLKTEPEELFNYF